MLYEQRKYNLSVIINKCLGFYDLKSNKGCIFFMKFSINCRFLHRNISLKLYLYSQNLYMQCFLKFLMLMYNDIL